MELARSVITGEILNAKVAWEKSCSDNELVGRSLFRCLDDDHCGIQMTLTNYGVKEGLRKYFKRHNIEHAADCVMEHGSNVEKEQLQKALTPILTTKELQNIIETGNKNIVICEPQSLHKNENLVEFKSVEITKKEQEELFQKNKENKKEGVSDSQVSFLGSLYSYYLDKPETIVKSIDWSFYNRENKKMNNDSFVKQNFPIRDIFCEIQEDTYLEWGKGKVFVGKAWVNAIDETHGHDTTIKFITKPDITICWAHSSEMKGMPNVDLLRRARQNGFPIEICVAGYFYNDKKSGQMKFKMRTNSIKNCLYIPNEDK